MEKRKSSVGDLEMNYSFWKGRRVLITGHTGFKGSWLSLWLNELGAKLSGYALSPETETSFFSMAEIQRFFVASNYEDIRDGEKLCGFLKETKPEVVFHLAAQPLVRQSYADPVGTYEINVMGTVNLFNAVRSCPSIRAVVNITTDKVYENKEWLYGYREVDRLGGYDPYSNSKACSELVTAAFRDSFFNIKNYSDHRVAIATARAGNVIGGGDWAADRLVPDCIRAFHAQKEVLIRFPKSTRPWQHVLDPLAGYLLLAERLCDDGPTISGSWNFGPGPDSAKPVDWMVENLKRLWGDNASYKVQHDQQPHEAGFLYLDSSKARSLLGWTPRLSISEALHMSVEWYKSFYQGNADPYKLCSDQIIRYMSLL